MSYGRQLSISCKFLLYATNWLSPMGSCATTEIPSYLPSFCDDFWVVTMKFLAFAIFSCSEFPTQTQISFLF
ncbi:hypothetical protein RchiOBHm_Chr4g0436901 [Rosa chinensis]|uniref:Uncharacterized protein n=1 Tax=Rosa chinensis TaxID=74649 RepID=A0A2P6R256_ROSCH|nr:hypothetical protein RchiOBHm_Chr4g0436901 [Rosa chinensis]